MLKRTAFLIALLFLLPTFIVAAPEITPLPSLGLSSIEKLNPQGVYVIYIFKDGEWQEVGSLSFDRFFREREIDLVSYLPAYEVAKIRLVQKGGGAAHIDSVFLGGRPPIEVKGIEDNTALEKLSGKDFDVVDAYHKSMEFVFLANGENNILRLTARVEDETITKTPFQFPAENLFKEMNEKSQFFPYRLNGQEVGSMIDDNVEEPFFQKFSLTGTGHPSGYTYGWVKNDYENLYVRIDFTVDNTMDGEKDYAKVYVKTDAGLREFKVSVTETKWGVPHFTYTDKVAYQHKVYDFTISLSELGIENDDEELLLAFATYGTGAPAGTKRDPSIAYDPQNNRYLIVYSKKIDGGSEIHDIYGQLINPDGTPSGSDFVISNATKDQQLPSVAYDSINGRFLVVWRDFRNGTDNNIHGQLVNASDGSLFNTGSNTNFVVSNAANSQNDPSVAYDSANGMFLVVWEDFRNGTDNNIHGQLVNGTDGSLFGPPSTQNFAISDVTNSQFNPSVVFDSANGRFLVAWQDNRGADNDIYGQLVNGTDGSLFGPPSTQNFTISDAPGNQTSPTAAYDSTNGRFLVAWHVFIGGTNNDIYGQLVNGTDGSLFGPPSTQNFTISDNPNNQLTATVAYESTNGRFLVAWRDDRNVGTNFDIYSQFVNTDGSLLITTSASNSPTYTVSNDQNNPVVAYNSSCSNSLVVFLTKETTPEDVGLALVGASCAKVSVTPTTNDFGSVNVSSSSTSLEVTISNTATSGNLNVSGMVLSDTTNYSFDATSGGTSPCGNTTPTLTAGGSCTSTVTFNPLSTGTKTATITINSNVPPSSVISLTGNAITANILLSPANYDFGSVTEGSSSPTLEVTIINNGNADLVVSGMSLSSTKDFTLNSSSGGTSPCGNLTPTVAPSSKCTVGVTFSPGSSGNKTVSLTVTSNDLDTPSASASLTGSGLSAPSTPSPTNQAPTAKAGSDQTVNEKKSVILDGTGTSDPDNDPLTYSWTQTVGATVTLNGSNSSRPDFTTPDVSSDTTLSFQLIVSDGNLSSSPSTTNVTIRPIGRLTVAEGDKNPSTVDLSDTSENVSLMQVSLAADDEDIKLTSMAFTIDLISFRGSTDGNKEVDIGGFKLYEDNDDDGKVSSDDTKLGEETFSSSDRKIAFDGLSETISKGASGNLLLVYDMAAGASPNATIAGRIGIVPRIDRGLPFFLLGVAVSVILLLVSMRLLPSRRRGYAAGFAVVVILVLILSGCDIFFPPAEEASDAGLPTGPTEESTTAEVTFKVYIQNGSDIGAEGKVSDVEADIVGEFPMEGATATVTIEG